MLTVLYFTPLNQTLSPSLAAYIQPGDAEATAHAPLSGKYFFKFWEPKTNLHDGINNIINYYKK